MTIKTLRTIVDDLESQLSAIRDLSLRISSSEGTYAKMDYTFGTDTKPLYRNVLTVEMDISYHLTAMKKTLELWENCNL